MKVWFVAQLEKTDEAKQCCKCRVWQSSPRFIWVENEILSGNLPNPEELHPEPTGNYMCLQCAKMTLV